MEPTTLLNEKEEVLLSIKPDKKLVWWLMMRATLWYCFLIFYWYLQSIFKHVPLNVIWNVIIPLFPLFLFISYTVIKILLPHGGYFITNQRCILYWNILFLSHRYILINDIVSRTIIVGPFLKLSGLTQIQIFGKRYYGKKEMGKFFIRKFNMHGFLYEDAKKVIDLLDSLREKGKRESN